MGSREGVCWGESPLYPQTKRDTARICKWWWDGSKISHLHVKTHWDCIRWSTFLISITPKHLFTVIEKIPPTEPIAAVSPPADHETPQLKSTGILGWNVHRLKALFEDLKWKEQLHTDKQQPKAFTLNTILILNKQNGFAENFWTKTSTLVLNPKSTPTPKTYLQIWNEWIGLSNMVKHPPNSKTWILLQIGSFQIYTGV